MFSGEMPEEWLTQQQCREGRKRKLQVDWKVSNLSPVCSRVLGVVRAHLASCTADDANLKQGPVRQLSKPKAPTCLKSPFSTNVKYSPHLHRQTATPSIWIWNLDDRQMGTLAPAAARREHDPGFPLPQNAQVCESLSPRRATTEKRESPPSLSTAPARAR